jgi:hypothetical protein
MAWEDNLGNKFDTYEEYCQSKYIDFDEVCILLWQGFRTPQNDVERRIKAEIDERSKIGESFEVYSNL